MKSTKELAKQLGLLRKRTHQHSVKTTNNYQDFVYLIVLDFESTCWEGQRSQSQEIIEFPCVLLNMASGEVESEFHEYVQPHENPTLSDFCRGLTGITQLQVDEGIPLSICLRRFTRWLDSLRDDHEIMFYSDSGSNRNKRCTFVTWSDWDLGVCLHYECQRKNLKRPPEMSSWIDLRATYRRFYDRKPAGLEGALRDVGIEFCGRQHSGADDARNTARLAYRMASEGCVLKVTKTMKNKVYQDIWPESTICLKRDHKTVTPNSPLKNHEKADGARAKRVNMSATPKCEQPTAHTRTAGMTEDKITNLIKKLPLSDVSNRVTLCTNKCDKIDGKTYETTLSTISSSISCSVTGRRSSELSTRSKPNTTIGEKMSSKTTYCGNVVDGNDVYCEDEIQQKDGKFDAPHEGLSASKIQAPNKTRPITSKFPKSHSSKSNTLLTSLSYKTPCRSPSNISSFKIPTNHYLNSTTNTTNTLTHLSTHCTNKSFRTTNCMNSPANITINSSTNTSFNKTPTSTMNSTPPLCQCGKRAKRKVSQSPGPNEGRTFFTCSVSRASFGSFKTGCNFFQWEKSNCVLIASISNMSFRHKTLGTSIRL